MLQTDHNHWLWLLENCRLIFAEELRIDQDRLLKKLSNLSLQQHGKQLNCSKTNTYKRINWLVNNLLKDITALKGHHLDNKPILNHKTEPKTIDASASLDNASSSSNVTGSEHSEWLSITGARLWDISLSCLYSVGCWLQTVLSHLIFSFYKCSDAICGYAGSSADKSPQQVISPVITSITTATSTPVSQLPKTQPRLVNLSKRVINPRTIDVLEKGPKILPLTENYVKNHDFRRSGYRTSFLCDEMGCTLRRQKG